MRENTSPATLLRPQRRDRANQALRIDANQRLFAISTDLTSPEATLAAFDEFERVHAGSSGSTEVPDSPVGTSSVAKCPDYVFACTGASEDRLGYFTEMSPDTLRKGFESNYLTALWTSHVSGLLVRVGAYLPSSVPAPPRRLHLLEEHTEGSLRPRSLTRVASGTVSQAGSPIALLRLR